MGPLGRCALALTVCTIPPTLIAQERGTEIGVDGGFEYAFDADLLTIAVPFQRLRVAFPSGDRLSWEPNFSFTRLSTQGASVAALTVQVGALYSLGARRERTFARPFAGFEYADFSGSDSETVFDLGVGFGTRSRILDRLALRVEGTLTGRFGQSGGADAALGATAGLSFYTR